MTNMAIENAIKALGLEFIRTQVGDRYVLEALHEKGWVLGGEGSGHLLVLDKHSTGDGMISALQVLESCLRSQKTPAQLLHGIDLFPQVLLNVKLTHKAPWTPSAQLLQAQEDATQRLGNLGRVLIRASGTEPLVRVMVEASKRSVAQDTAQYLSQWV